MLANLMASLQWLTWDDLLAFLLRLSALTALAWLALKRLPRASAALRHQVAIAALAAAVLLPLASAFVPALPLPLLPPRAGAPSHSLESQAADAAQDMAPMSFMVPDGPVYDDPTAHSAARPALAAPRPSLPRRLDPGTLVLAALAVTAVLVLRWLIFLLAARSLMKRALPVTDATMLGELEQARERLGIRRAVGLRETSRLAIPIVWGIARPVLLVPSAAREWPVERLRVVLLHELAHVARQDALGLVIARVATAVLWFHPLVWALARRARWECEQACDDVVLGAGARPTSYAEHLLAIARGALGGDRLGDVVPALARRSSIERRLIAILSPAGGRGPASKRTLIVVAAAAMLLALSVAAVRVVAAPAGGAAPESREPMATASSAIMNDGPIDAMRTRDGQRSSEATFESERTSEATAEKSTESTVTSEQRLAGSTTLEPAGSRSGEEWFEVGRRRYEAEHYDEAATAYLRAAMARYRPETALYNAACCYALDGQRAEAIEVLEQAINQGFDPDQMATDDDLNSLRSEPRFRRLLARATTGDGAQGKRSGAMARYEALQSSRSEDTDAWHDVGIELMRSGEFARAADSFERQNAIDGSASAIYNQACAWSLAGERDKALDLLDRSIRAGYGDANHMDRDADLAAIRDDPRYDELHELAKDLELQGTFLAMNKKASWRTTLRHYESVAQRHPDIGRAWFNLGYARLGSGDAEGGAEAFEQALKLDYRTPTTMFNLACASARMHDVDETIRWLERAERAGYEVADKLDDNDLDPVRSDPRFERLVDRLESQAGAGEYNKKHKYKQKTQEQQKEQYQD